MIPIKSISQFGFAFLFLLLSISLSAQVQSPRSTSAEAMANDLTKYEVEALKLDGKEAKDLKQINLLYAERILEIRKKASSESSKTEEEALKRSHGQKIKSLLSSQKYQEYLALKKEDKEEK